MEGFSFESGLAVRVAKLIKQLTYSGNYSKNFGSKHLLFKKVLITKVLEYRIGVSFAGRNFRSRGLPSIFTVKPSRSSRKQLIHL